VEFRLLGPLEVIGEDGTIPLTAAKQRTVLGVLLLFANEVVSRDRLADELWGERRPRSAEKLVETYVAKLRAALGASVIETRAPGYLLRAEDEALDVGRFRRLVSEARLLMRAGKHMHAAALYCEALLLWHGSPLADVDFESAARVEADRLEEERLAALMDRIDCELLLDQDHELVPELQTLTRRYPLRERLRAQLMLALYRSGRQVEALEVYAEIRRLLYDELGLEPSPRLRELEREILRHDPKLALPALPGQTHRRRLPSDTYATLLSQLASELGDYGQTDSYAEAALKRLTS
jgi:DNA-binding SARP family transcriptional activator